jgi:hypothetical protein
VATAEGDTDADAAAGRLGVRDLLLGQRSLVLAELILKVEIRTTIGVAHVVSHEWSFRI